MFGSKACGVYDLGCRHYGAISNTKKYEILYCEINTIQHYLNVCEQESPDAVIFNYMDCTLPWVSRDILKYKCVKYCIPHYFKENNLTSFKNEIFDYYIILDKNSKTDSVCWKTNRPLINFNNNNVSKNLIPKIGSFGFAFTHKNFHKIVRHVNESFDNAEINFYMTRAYYDAAVNQTNDVIQSCLNEINHSGISINFTTDFLPEAEVIKNLNKNDINILFYESYQDVGISSSLDYLVSAQKPILISESSMFRSFSDQLPTFPSVSVKDIFEEYDKYQTNINNIYKNSINTVMSDTEFILDNTLT